MVPYSSPLQFQGSLRCRQFVPPPRFIVFLHTVVFLVVSASLGGRSFPTPQGRGLKNDRYHSEGPIFQFHVCAHIKIDRCICTERWTLRASQRSQGWPKGSMWAIVKCFFQVIRWGLYETWSKIPHNGTI